MPESPDNTDGKKIYVIPSDVDVLCGRGVIPFQHTGNRKLRQVIADKLESYNLCPSRQGRTTIIRDTIDYFHRRGGLFLKADHEGQWYDGGIEAAKSRVSTAFRDARVPNKVKCMEILKKKKETSTIPPKESNQIFASRTRRASLSALSHKNFASSRRRDSLSSLCNFLLGSPTRSSSLDSGGTKSTFASYAPTITPSTRQSLDTSISTLDSEFLSGLILPSDNILHSAARSSTSPTAAKSNNTNNKKVAHCHNNNDTDRLDFGGRNFFDVTESDERIIPEESNNQSSNHAGASSPAPKAQEEILGSMISFSARSA
mmetsp:Transcript_6196/g.9515  ORF Transcript_6196/g.9515 Transcript_6196/m.9515 type:complete len:316 (-) Transcript_6196:253-1200(-)